MPDVYRELTELQQHMSSLSETNYRLHHAAVVTSEPLSSDRDLVIKGLRQFGLGPTDVEHIVLRVKSGIVLEHIFFDVDRTGVEVLQHALFRINTILKRLPEGTVPQLWIPKLDDAANARVARWMCLLYDVALNVDRQDIRADVMHSRSEFDLPDQVVFEPADSLQAASPFDPRPYVTLAERDIRPLTDLSKEPEHAGLPFPDRFAAHLTKNVFLVSRYVIEYLRLRGRDLEATGATPKKRSQTKRPTKSKDDKFYQFTSLLIQHHTGGSNLGHKAEPLIQGKIEEQLPFLNQSLISNFFADVFGSMNQYKLYLRGPGGIKRVLSAIRRAEEKWQKVEEDDDPY